MACDCQMLRICPNKMHLVDSSYVQDYVWFAAYSLVLVSCYESIIDVW